MRFANTEETFDNAYYGLISARQQDDPTRGQLVVLSTDKWNLVARYIGQGASEWLQFPEVHGSDFIEFNDDEFKALCEAFDKLFGGA